MPATDDSSSVRSGFNCAIGLLNGTVVGDAMVRDYGHIARRNCFIRSGLGLQWAIATTSVGMAGGVLE